MKTSFDFISLILFAFIAVVYLHRSAQTTRDRMPLWTYALAAAGCAFGDVLANHGYVQVGAVALAVTLVGAFWIALKGAPRSNG